MDIPTESKCQDGNLCWAFNDLIKRDPENKKQELRKLAMLGCTEAMVYMGVMFVDGTDDEKARAPALFLKAAEHGDNMGMRNMGYCYALGLCVEKDKSKAVEWYRKAAEAGNAKAQCNLGVMYEYGNGVDVNMKEAVKWFRESASKGYSRGQTNYGIHLLNGTGVERDPAAAAEQFDLARTPRANYRLAKMYLEGVGVEKNITFGVTLLELSAAKGYAKAIFMLGTIFEIDHPEYSYDLYQRAAAKGNKDAADRLNGLGLSVPERTPRKVRMRLI